MKDFDKAQIPDAMPDNLDEESTSFHVINVLRAVLEEADLSSYQKVSVLEILKTSIILQECMHREECDDEDEENESWKNGE